MTGPRRNLAALRLSGVVALLGAIALALVLVGSLRHLGRRARAAAQSLRRHTLQRGARALLAILGVRVRCIGTPPGGRSVLVSNHLSYLDVAVLASVAPSVFVAKSEVRVWPLLGPIVRAFGTVFLDRERKVDLPLALAAIEEALRQGEGVVLFPEGTTSDGSNVAPFRSSLLALPARRGLPVHAAALHYATPAGEPPAAESVCWWGDGELLPHLTRLAGLTRIEATLRFAPEPIADPDRKRLAARLEEEVRALSGPSGLRHGWRSRDRFGPYARSGGGSG
jgi:1-acyl-sn-glycerol-3-phosphate acyltransferase